MTEEPLFQDHFSGQASAYAAHRPTYPDALFEALAAAAPGRELAWDAATGSGQAAIALAARFERVVATDASADQIRHAVPHPRVHYTVAAAEAAVLAPGSVDLVTVAQAAHWFDLDRFHAEVRRVARPGAVVARWAYTRTQVTGPVDAVVAQFMTHSVGPDWPLARQQIDLGYDGMPFPFAPIALPPFEMARDLDRTGFLAYIDTWSAVARHRARTGTDPLPGLDDALAPHWPDGTSRTVRWPLVVQAGHVP